MDTQLMASLPPEQVAFELWATIANRRPQRVVQLMNQFGANNDRSITTQTIHAWAKEFDWAVKAHEFLEQIAPDAQYQTYATVMQATEEAVDYIRNVINGNYWPELSADQIKALDPDDPRLNPNLVRTRVQAAKDMAHMGGLSPNRTNDPMKPQDPFANALRLELAGLSTDELLAREEQKRKEILEQNQQRAAHIRNKGNGIRS